MNPKLSLQARIVLGLGLGIMLATNVTQGDDPVQGLALIVIWPMLFLLGLATGIIGGKFLPRAAWLSAGTSVPLVIIFSTAIAALPALRGYLYLRDVAAKLRAVDPTAQMVSSDYVSPLNPRLVSLNLRTDQPSATVLEVYDRGLRGTGWHNDSLTPFSRSWVDDSRNRIMLFIRAGGTIELLWTRHSS